MIRFISAAKEAVPYTTMKGVGIESSEEPKYYSRCVSIDRYTHTHIDECNIFSTSRILHFSMACGINLVLSSHLDKDFMLCAVVAFKVGYNPRKDRNRILVYFTFPGLGNRGITVKMLHGQVVILNARQVSIS